MASLRAILDPANWRGPHTQAGRLALPAVLMLTLTAALLFIPQFLEPRFNIAWDGSFYLSDARYIHDGQGYLAEPGMPRLGRPPGFPALLAAALLLGGPDVSSAIWLVRFAGLAAVLMVGVLSHRLFGLTVALLVVAWVAANQFFAEHFSRILLLDMTQTALTLAFVWLVFEASKRGSLFVYALAGASVAAAFWVKESALILLPLPILAVFINPAWHTWRHFWGLLVYGCAAVALILPWFVWVYLASSSFYRTDSVAMDSLASSVVLMALAGAAVAALVALLAWQRRRAWFPRLAQVISAPNSRALLGWVIALAAMAFLVFMSGIPEPTEASRHFWRRVEPIDLRPLEYLGPLMWAVIIMGWLFALNGAIRRNPADVVLVAALLASVPLIAFVADRNLHPRNYFLVMMLTHVALGRMVVSLAAWAGGRLKPYARSKASALAQAGAWAVLAILLLLPARLAFVSAQELVAASPDSEDATAQSFQASMTKSKLTAWRTREVIPPGERIHISASPPGALLRFELGDTYQSFWIRRDWIQSQELEAGLQGKLPGRDSDGQPYRGLSGIVFIESNRTLFVGDRELDYPDYRMIQTPDMVSGGTPRYLIWSVNRTFPDVVPQFLLQTGMATELRRRQNNTWFLQLKETSLPNVLLINEKALDEIDGADDGMARLSPGLAEAVRHWRIVVLDMANTANPPRRQLCDGLRSAVPGLQCQEGFGDSSSKGRGE